MKKFLIIGACAAAMTFPAAAQTVDPGNVLDAVRGIYDATRGVNRYPYTVPYNNYTPAYPNYQQHYNLSSPLDIVYTNLSEGSAVGSAFTLQGYTTPFNRVDLSVRGRGLRGNSFRQSTQADANGNFVVNVDASRVPFNNQVTVSARAIDGDGRVGPNNNLHLIRR